MKIAKSLLLILVLLTFTGCSSQASRDYADDKAAAEAAAMAAPDLYTLEDISAHNSKDDCWFAVHSRVYDVTAFMGKHPGGETILEGCGMDATKLFETRPMGSGTPHSDGAREGIENYYIGELK